MKKLLGISALAMVLAACSSPNDRPPAPPQGQGPQQNPQVEAALKACHESVGQTQDQAKFEACMKEKGFQRPGAQSQPPVAEQTAAAAEQQTTTAKSTAKSTVKKAVKKVKTTKTK